MTKTLIHRDPPVETPDEAQFRVKYWLLDACDRFYSPHEGLHRALVDAGFSSILIERLPTHGVWSIRVSLPPGWPSADRRLLTRQIRDLLEAARMAVKRDEIIVMLAGRRLHVSFVQQLGRGVMMRDGVATLIEDNDPDLFLEYDE